MIQPTGLLKKHGTDVFPRPVHHSALFDGISDHLSRTPSGAGDGRTWTFRTWMKLAETDHPQNGPALLNVQTDEDNRAMLFLEAGALRFVVRIGGSEVVDIGTDALFADPTGWGDLCVRFDSTRTAEGDRYVVEWNGAEVPLTTTAAVPPGLDSLVHTPRPHHIGRHVYSGEVYDGYLADTWLIDGSALPASTWGEFSSLVSGLWVTKGTITLSFGVNGCRLDFSDAAALGRDCGGNGNDWTVTGSPVQTADSPTNNHCTLNALDPGAGDLGNGSLTLAGGTARPTLQPETGQWYYEKDGAGISYDADASGRFEPDLTPGTYNFGATPWDDAGPSGSENPLCSARLPDPAVLRSAAVADVVLREGTGAAAAVASLEFSPDFVNIKDRDAVRDWGAFDSGRTATHLVSTNSTGSDAVDADSLTSFDANGYTLGASSLVNRDNGSFIDLCLRAGPDQGFEVVTYSGDGVAGRTIAHGLGQPPTFMVIKNVRFAPTGWVVYHAVLGATGYLTFNTSAAITASYAFDDTEPTATDFTLGGNTGVNGAGYDYVAYLFADSSVFRAFSYEGNGLADGPFVNLGGKPLAIPFLKDAAGGGTNWLEHSAVQSPFNPADQCLYPNLDSAEGSGGNGLLFTSQGVKIANNGGDCNTSGDTYVGLAILESAGKYANAF